MMAHPTFKMRRKKGKTLKDLVIEAIDKGATSVEDVYKSISNLPLELFEKFDLFTNTYKRGKQSREKTIGDIHDMISNLYEQVEHMASILLQNNSKLKKKTKRQFRTPSLSWVDFIYIFIVSLLGCIIFNQSNPNGISLIPKSWSDEAISNVAPAMAMAKYQEGETLFVDARPTIFFEQGHIEGSINMPLALFDIMYMMEFSEVDKARDIVVYGRTISSLYDEHAARKFILRGHDNTMIFKSGLAAWKRKGYPVKP